MAAANCAQLPENARILVVRLSALGDLVFALPAVTALRQRFPDARIDWLVEDRHASLLETLPYLHSVRVFPRRGWRSPGGLLRMARHFRALRRGPTYDCVLDFQGNLKSAIQVSRIRSPLKIGFAGDTAREGAHRFYHHHVSPPPRCHRSVRDLALIECLGWQGEMPIVPPWSLPAEAVEYARSAWPEDGIRRVLLHHAVTSYGRDKEWLPQKWADLAVALRDLGLHVALLWTPAEEARARSICDASGGAAELAPATPSLAHLMALLDRADLVIGTDSGPVHLAALRSRPVVALYGPTDPQRFSPPGTQVEVVRALEAGVEPPRRDRSHRSPLMDAIEVAPVAAAAAKLLASSA